MKKSVISFYSDKGAKMSEDNKIIRFLNERRFTVLFSGGKDSLATLLWVLDNVKHDDWNILYIEVTGNTHELCNEYVHKVCGKLGVHDKLIHVKREDLDFFECLKKWGVPILRHSRWCLTVFKTPLMRRYAYITQVTGIKRTDSKRRSKIAGIGVFRNPKSVSVNPLYDWDNDKVIDFIKEHGVELNPCYKIYRHAGNCMFCPNRNTLQIKLTMSDPYWGRKIVDALRCVRGKISRKIAKRWLQYANIKPITSFLQV